MDGEFPYRYQTERKIVPARPGAAGGVSVERRRDGQAERPTSLAQTISCASGISSSASSIARGTVGVMASSYFSVFRTRLMSRTV